MGRSRGISKEAFNKKEDYFDYTWHEIVTSMEDCIGLIDDGEEQGNEQIQELREHIEILKEKK